jgi:hypothetical protein
MNAVGRLFCVLLIAAPLAGAAAGQTPPAEAAGQPSAQEQFDTAKALYVRDMGYFNDEVNELRKANAAGPNGTGSPCMHANLTVVSLGAAQNELAKMIELIEAAHQDATAYRADFKEHAEQLALRKASLAKSGCG